jgi:hypothetical protein
MEKTHIIDIKNEKPKMKFIKENIGPIRKIQNKFSKMESHSMFLYKELYQVTLIFCTNVMQVTTTTKSQKTHLVGGC